MESIPKKYLINAGIEFSQLEIEVSAELAKQPSLKLEKIKLQIRTDGELREKNSFLIFVRICPIHKPFQFQMKFPSSWEAKGVEKMKKRTYGVALC